MASSSNKAQSKSENEQSQENISSALLEVIHKRSEVPQRLKRIEEKILTHEQSQAEKVTVLPSTDTKRVTSRYPLKKPLPEEFKISKETPIQPEELQTRVEQLSKNVSEVKKAMVEQMNKKK